MSDKFIIRNTLPGQLPLQLEKGGVILNSGQQMDLAEQCSAEWLELDPTINKLLNAGHLEKVLEKPVKSVEKKADPVIPKPPATPPKVESFPPEKPKEKKAEPKKLDDTKPSVVSKAAPEEDPVEAFIKKPVVRKSRSKKRVKKTTVNVDDY